MKIFLEFSNKNVFASILSTNDKILNLNNEIDKLFGSILQYWNLKDDKTCYEYKIEKKSLINADSGENGIFVEIRNEISLGLKLDNLTDFELRTKRVQEKIRIARGDQILIYDNALLEDGGKSLREFGISENSVIRVLDRSRSCGIEIFARTMNGQTIRFEALKSDKIIDIKKKIQYKIKLCLDQQELIYQGEILDDDKMLDEYEICEKSMLSIVLQLRGGAGNQLFVKVIDTETITICIEGSDKIIDIKYKIQDETGLNPDRQKLIYKYVILDDDKTINEYKILENPVINIVARFQGFILIFVKIQNGEKFLFEAQHSDKIIDIKYKIQDKTGLNPDEQTLICQGEVLDDEKTIDQYRISSNAIDFISISNNKILIFAKIINGKKLIFTMPINSKIADVKNEINRKLELTINDEILIYHDNMSHDNDDSKLINQYQSNMILKLTIRSKYEKSFIIDLSKHEDTREIKKSIKSKLKINENYEKIFFNNKQLLINDEKNEKNDEVIYSYEIVPRSIIDLDCELREFRLFIQSIKKGSFDDVQKYFHKEFLEKKHGSYLRYPIHYAVRYGHLEIINYLINQQCNIESVDFENMRPIHYACYYGTGDILKLFIENKCNLESSDLMNSRPIHFACYCGNIETINLLIENRCELEIQDLMKLSPLKIVRNNNFDELSETLEEEIQKRKIDKILTAMKLRCTHQCDHKNCYTSFFQSLLTKTFDTKDLIGQGGFGKVYKCQEPFTNKRFAVKIIDSRRSWRKYIEDNINNYTEILDHPRIIKYFGAVEKEPILFIFMELLSGNSLQKKIKSRISASKVIQYTKQMLEALKYLHERNIIHRDIKPENSLLDDNDNVKIVDFGFSLMLTKTNGITKKAVTDCGTDDFKAPEIMNKLYTFSADIWSLGVSVIYMATGKMPVIHRYPAIKIEYKLPDSLPTYFQDLIGEMLIPDPEIRISAEQSLNKLELYLI